MLAISSKKMLNHQSTSTKVNLRNFKNAKKYYEQNNTMHCRPFLLNFTPH